MRCIFEYKGRKGWAEWPPDDTTWEEVFKRIRWEIDMSYDGSRAIGSKCFSPSDNVRWEWSWEQSKA